MSEQWVSEQWGSGSAKCKVNSQAVNSGGAKTEDPKLITAALFTGLALSVPSLLYVVFCRLFHPGSQHLFVERLVHSFGEELFADVYPVGSQILHMMAHIRKGNCPLKFILSRVGLVPPMEFSFRLTPVFVANRRMPIDQCNFPGPLSHRIRVGKAQAFGVLNDLGGGGARSSHKYR